MPSIFGFPLPDNYVAGVSFEISKTSLRDHHLDLAGFRAELIAGQKRLHVVLGQKSAGSTTDQLIEQALPVAQDFLDHLAVQQQLSYRILGSEDCIIWERIGDRYKFEIRATLSVTTSASFNPRLVRPDGSVQPPQPSPPTPQAKAFRYYRFASSSEDLFDAYRYLYLSFENTLQDFFPKQKKQLDRDWLKDGLRKAMAAYNLDLSAYAIGGSDPVDKFYNDHYQLIRCATFHAKSSTLIPGNPTDVKQVHDEILIFQPIVTQFIKAHFNVSFPASGMTPYAMNKILAAVIPFLPLATSPRTASLSQEIQTALATLGYFDEIPESTEEIPADTVDQLKRLIGAAQVVIPFNLTPITLEGKRKGYDDEWIITAKTNTDALQHHTIRSMALCLLTKPSRLPDASNIFVTPTVITLTGKTVSTDLDLAPNCDVDFRIRVVLRLAQQFPRDFASS